MIGDCPGRRRGHAIAARQAVGLIGKRVFVIRRMQPYVGAIEEGIVLRHEPERRQTHQRTRWYLDEERRGAIGGCGEDGARRTWRPGGDAVFENRFLE